MHLGGTPPAAVVAEPQPPAPAVLLDIGGIARYAPRPGASSLPARKQGTTRWQVAPNRGADVRLDLVEVMKQEEKAAMAAIRDVVGSIIARALLENDGAPGESTTSADGADATAGFVMHRVDPRLDSLTGLSIRYGVPVQQIRRDNGLSAFTDSIKALDVMRIRRPSDAKSQLLAPRLDKKELDLKKFMKATGLSKQESQYYMSISEDDFEVALAEWKSDMEWESANSKKPIATFEMEQ